jgi:succinoglycan biosynthesis protein ExoO
MTPMPQQSRAGRDGPLITIVVAAYNAAEFIDRAIKSAGEQVGVSLEFLVVDDASTDNTLAVMTEMARLDSRIIPISSKVNLGPAGARNLALDLAQGDWIAVLDSDDSFKPNRLNEMVRVATEVAADIVIDDFVSVDAKGTMLDGACLADRRGSGTIALEDWISFNSFTRAETSFGYAKPLISRVFLEQAKLRYNGTLRNGEDFHLILEALLSEAKVHFSARTGYV